MAILDFFTLRRTSGNPQNDGQQMLSVIDTMFQPREVVFSGTGTVADCGQQDFRNPAVRRNKQHTVPVHQMCLFPISDVHPKG